MQDDNQFFYDLNAEAAMRTSWHFNTLVLAMLDRARIAKQPNRELSGEIIERREDFAGIELPPLRWMNTPAEVFTFLTKFDLQDLRDMPPTQLWNTQKTVSLSTRGHG